MKSIIYRLELKKYSVGFYKDHTDLSESNKINSLFGDFSEGRTGYSPKSSNRFKNSKPQDLLYFTFHKSTNDEKDFELNYDNPLCQLDRTLELIVLEKEGSKVSLKRFFNNKNRLVGELFFRKKTRCDYLTFNTEKGFLYSGFIENYHKKRNFTKSVKKNYFAANPIQAFTSFLKNKLNHFHIKDSSIVAHEIINKFIEECSIQPHLYLSPDELIFREYLIKNNIKIPNNFYVFRNLYYKQKPLLKDYRKYNYKMVDTVMKKNDLTGKSLKKILHLVTKLNVDFYKVVLNLFGEEVLHKDESLLKSVVEFPGDFITTTIPPLYILFSASEFKRVKSVFKEVIIEQKINLYTFIDHIDYYIFLKEHGETDIKWKSTSADDSFQQEHLDWSDKISFYRKGIFERIYPHEFEIDCCKPIYSLGVEYYPKLLKNSEEFNEESKIQSNCVKNYVSKLNSIIFSMRKNSINSIERLTIEYDLFKYPVNESKTSITARRIQDRAKFNRNPSDEWEIPLNELDDRVNKFVNSEKYQDLKIKKICANGKIFESEGKWLDGRLEFTDIF